ncbi:MAG: hypothetical protein ACI4JY_06615 [Oscillospiraceae bacterium]
MKSYEEVTRDLLKRRDEYEVQKTQRRKAAFRVAMPVCAAGLAAAVGIGLWQSGTIAKLPIVDWNSQSTASNPMQDKLIFNKNHIGFTSMDIDLEPEDFVSMSLDEMPEYYGAEIRPDVPEDLKLGDCEYGIYKKDGGKGEVYWDNTSLYYFNELDFRIINVEVAKDRLPPSCCIVESNNMKKSLINGVEVILLGENKGFMYAEFMVADVGFRINANGLTGEEFVEAVRSIIVKNS